MLTTMVRGTATLKRALTQLQQQRRHGGSFSKNKHIENWNNWRGDSEKRFAFNDRFYKSLATWGIVPFTLYYVLDSDERRKRDVHNGNSGKFRQ